MRHSDGVTSEKKNSSQDSPQKNKKNGPFKDVNKSRDLATDVASGARTDNKPASSPKPKISKLSKLNDQKYWSKENATDGNPDVGKVGDTPILSGFEREKYEWDEFARHQFDEDYTAYCKEHPNVTAQEFAKQWTQHYLRQVEKAKTIKNKCIK